MKLGSHNSITFARPRYLWQRILGFLGKCQSKTLEEQFEAGCRIFDFRIVWEGGDIKYKHGIIEYDVRERDVMKFLRFLNNKAKKKDEEVWVRFMLERLNISTVSEDSRFINYMKRLVSELPYIKFFGLARKYDEKILLETKHGVPNKIDLYSSSTWKVFDDWWPWLYAKIMNKKNLKNPENQKYDYLFMDFV